MNVRPSTIRRAASRAARVPCALAALGVMAAAAGPAAGSDGKAPAPPEKLRVHPGEAWSRQREFTLNWSNPTHPKPIAAAYYRLCPVEAQRRCKDGKQREPDVHRLRLTVPDAGDYTVTVWLKDQAGHVNSRHRCRAVHLRFDDEPPTSDGLQPEVDGDPTLLELPVRDKLSGPGHVEVEMRPRDGGSWRSLATSEAAAKRVRVRIPDVDLPDGEYELRALVRDRAGNRASIGDGKRESMPIRLPLRRRTAIGATLQRNTTTRSCRSVTTTLAGRSRSRTVCRNLAVRASVPLPNPAPMTLRRGERPQIAGVARGVSAGASLDVVERPRSPGAAPRTSRLRVGPSGGFRLWLEPGPSRTVELNYAGDSRTLPSRLTATVLVPRRQHPGGQPPLGPQPPVSAVRRPPARRSDSPDRPDRGPAGALPRGVAHVRHPAGRRHGRVAVSLPLRRQPRANHLPLPRPRPARRRLSLRDRGEPHRPGERSRSVARLGTRGRGCGGAPGSAADWRSRVRRPRRPPPRPVAPCLPRGPTARRTRRATCRPRPAGGQAGHGRSGPSGP